MANEFERINSIIYTHFQFKKQFPDRQSLLFPEIDKALNCGIVQAEKLASTACNMLSMFAPIKTKELFDGGYSEFFRLMLDEEICNQKGFISDKVKMMKVLKIDSTLETFRDYDVILNPEKLNPDKFYQVKIFGDTSGDHFMGCYVKENVLYLSDTSYRGIDKKATEFITEKNFQKIMEVC